MKKATDEKSKQAISEDAWRVVAESGAGGSSVGAGSEPSVVVSPAVDVSPAVVVEVSPAVVMEVSPAVVVEVSSAVVVEVSPSVVVTSVVVDVSLTSSALSSAKASS